MSKLNIGEIKESSNPTDYEKAMLYHSDRADKYMDELASLREQLAKERELRIQLVNVLSWFADGYPLDAERISAKKLIQKAKGT